MVAGVHRRLEVLGNRFSPHNCPMVTERNLPIRIYPYAGAGIAAIAGSIRSPQSEDTMYLSVRKEKKIKREENILDKLNGAA